MTSIVEAGIGIAGDGVAGKDAAGSAYRESMPKIAAGDIIIRPADATDAEGIARIYNHFVSTTTITFETDPVAPEEIRNRIRETEDAGLCWLIAETATGDPLGYAYASRWKGRCAYRYSAESTIYIVPGHEGAGIGTALYGRLLSALRDKGIHAVLGGIALPNPASIGLHEKLGFEKVAHFREVGFKFDRRIDVGYWQVLLSGDGAAADQPPEIAPST